MLLIRPDAAHRVTVFGSTLKSAATSPGVSKRSLVPSIVIYSVPDGLSTSVAETRELSHKRQLYPSIRNIPSEQSVKLWPTPGKASKSGTRFAGSPELRATG